MTSLLSVCSWLLLSSGWITKRLDSYLIALANDADCQAEPNNNIKAKAFEKFLFDSCSCLFSPFRRIVYVISRCNLRIYDKKILIQLSAKKSESNSLRYLILYTLMAALYLCLLLIQLESGL